MTGQTKPEVKAAIAKGAIVDAVLLALGAVLWLATDDIAWFVGCLALGSAAFMLLLAQAGVFTGGDERH